jgi:hypothetical protein
MIGEKSSGMDDFAISGRKSFLIGFKIGAVRKSKNCFNALPGGTNQDSNISASKIIEYAPKSTSVSLTTIIVAVISYSGLLGRLK